VTAEESVQRWASKVIELGDGNCFVPRVLGPSGVPKITDEEQARAHPELAVLSAMAHANDPDPAQAAHIALLAQGASLGLDAERSTMYGDLVFNCLPEAARRALQAMDASKYQYQSGFARRYFGAGKAEGVAQGVAQERVEIVLKLLVTRYGELSARVVARVHEASTADLDAIAQRVLTAQNLDEALGTR